MTAPPAPEAPTFDQLYLSATGRLPQEHQARIAADGLPGALRIPAGEKTKIILAWLWRRLYGPDLVRAGTARRLIWALPRGALLEPAAAEIRGWLAGLELTEKVALQVVTGARAESVGEWREDMHRPAIVVGTVDMLVSKALNRGYGLSRTMFPVDFALTVNGTHWVIEEAQLCPQSTTTLRRLADFGEKAGTAEPFGLTLLSAQPRPPLTFRRLAAEPGDYAAIAASALDRHAPGTRTLVVLNTVDAAQQVYRRLRGGPVDVTLLHSRFRGIERAGRLSAIADKTEDEIVVATQVVEAGIGDLGAALLITEAAPWPSLTLRARHRDRTGEPSEGFWVPPPAPLPYARAGIDPVAHPAVIQPGELMALCDTSTYRSDDDIDIAPYVRDAEDLDVEVAWATWTPGENGAPDPEVRHPAPEYRCRVPIGEAVEFAKDTTVWRFNHTADRWTPLTQHAQSRPRPGELLLVNAADGGYDPELGFVPGAPEPVADSPELARPEAGEVIAAPADIAPRPWQSLNEHSQQVRDQAAALLAALAPHIPSGAAEAAILAGYLHDLGKAHPIWQDALCALADDKDRDEVAAGRPWAKSGTTAKTGRLEFASGRGFRHELASLMFLDGPLHSLLAASPDPDLTRYLVLAHHGKLRIRVPDPDPFPSDDEAVTMNILGLEQGATSDIPSVLGEPPTTLTVDLGQFLPDGERSWTGTALALVDKYGPYNLAYLETVVRMADWRASGGRELPESAR
jgi:CRISPR-associated endonuclease/helicase Cas3